MTRRVVCASNPKQIALAMITYGEENDGVDQPDADLAVDNTLIGDTSCHQWRNKLEMMNQAFADGHVEDKNSSEGIKVRYGYNASPNNRWLCR